MYSQQHSLQAYSRNLHSLFPVPILDDGGSGGYTTFEVGANGDVAAVDDLELQHSDDIEQIKELQDKLTQSLANHQQAQREAEQSADILATENDELKAQSSNNQKLKNELENMKQKRQKTKDAKKRAEVEAAAARNRAADAEQKATRAAETTNKIAAGTTLRGFDDIRDDPSDVMDLLAKKLS